MNIVDGMVNDDHVRRQIQHTKLEIDERLPGAPPGRASVDHVYIPMTAALQFGFKQLRIGMPVIFDARGIGRGAANTDDAELVSGFRKCDFVAAVTQRVVFVFAVAVIRRREITEIAVKRFLERK
ncbi:hypothetical protein MnTg02_00191 [bacterium MnTg02]|nr:hypothetical protein MnTg02_00191 [bacterium MnTg02]